MASKARATASIYAGTTVTVLDYITGQFDGVTKAFNLTINGASISLTDAYQVQIFIGGARLFPYRSSGVYIFLVELNQFDYGYTISGSTITFANAPSSGIPFNGMITTTGPSTIGTTRSSGSFNAIAVIFD